MDPVTILEILGILFDVVDIITDVAGDDANGETEITWGDSVSGVFEYYYVDENGATSLRSGNFSLSTSITNGWALLDSPDVKSNAIRNDATTGASPSFTYSNIGTNSARVTWNPGSFYTVSAYVAGYEKNWNNIQLSMPNSSAIPTFYYSGSQGSTVSVRGHIRSTTFVTGADNADKFSDAVYLPISGQAMSYDDIRNELTTYVNNIVLTETDTNGETVYSPDETITPDDLPTWDDIQNPTESETETDATEPDYQPVSIDYNEILSEDELESILNQESYNIPEIESITETIIIDIEDLAIEGTEQLEITGFIPDALAVGMDVFNELNISAPLTSAAIIACIWKIIKGG